MITEGQSPQVYLHRNPVKWGLTSTPADYPWSSYQTYASERQGIVFLSLV